MPRTLSLLLFLVVAAAPVSASAQDTKYRAPRTEAGQPDLQGVWNFSSGVPLERPAAFAGKKLFTKEESDAQRASVRNALATIVKLAPVEAVGLDWLDNAPAVDDLRTSLITHPDNGRLPALVKGVRRMPGIEDLVAALGNAQGGPPQSLFTLFASFGGGSRDSHTDFMMSERCLIGGEVPFVPQLDGNYVQIIQGRDHVVLVTDSSRRIVTLGGGPPPGDQLRHWSGMSRGRWEGETLVVDTRNFTDRTPSLAGAGNSRHKVVTERFTRTSNGRIEYAATVVDPQTFQDRVELSFPMAQVEAQIYEDGCHEGNYSMRNALAARLDDEARKVQRQRGPHQQLTVLDRTGAIVARVGEPGLYSQAAFSPDASQIAAIRTDIDTGVQDVWTFDVATGRGRAITSDQAIDSAPLWSPDGKALVYSSVRDAVHTVFRRAADGGGGEEQIYRHDTANAVILTDWSRDGRFLTFWSGQGMFILPLSGNRQPVAIEEGRGGRFSPDGRLIAYNTNEAGQAGRFHVFVRPFEPSTIAPAPPAAVRKVSQANAVGGIAWRADGKELYFLSQAPPSQTLMAVEVSGAGGFEASAPRALFQLSPGAGPPAQLSNVGSPDGQRFVFTVTVPPATAAAK